MRFEKYTPTSNKTGKNQYRIFSIITGFMFGLVIISFFLLTVIAGPGGAGQNSASAVGPPLSVSIAICFVLTILGVALGTYILEKMRPGTVKDIFDRFR